MGSGDVKEPIVGGRTPGRNDLCPCGSGLKYKWCHGDPIKVQQCQAAANRIFAAMISHEKWERGLTAWPYTCEACGHGFIKPDFVAPERPARPLERCPECGSSDLATDVGPK